MGIHLPPSSPYVKELAKWEHRPVMVGDTMIMPLPMSQGGKEHFPLTEYPKMLYRAERADGGPRLSGQILAHDTLEEARLRGQGWSVGPAAAIAAIHIEDQEFATLAANRAFTDRRMGDLARTEAATIDESTVQHVPVIPETPKKKRGRPVKLS